MTHRLGTLVVMLLLLQVLSLAVLAPAPSVEAQSGAIIVGPDEHLVWADGTRNLTVGVEVFGRMTVRDYELRFNLSVDGEASFRVMPGGLLEFDNVTLAHDNLSAYLFFKVEGKFVSHDSDIEYLTGQFSTGGGIKVVDGEVEMYDTRLHDCEVQGIYVEGTKGKVLLDNCTLEQMQYGVHVNDGGSVTLQNGCRVELFSRSGVLVNFGEADVSNTTIISDNTSQTQGIGARGSILRVEDTSIHAVRNQGIELADSTEATITDCDIWDCTVGVKLSDSDAEIWSCFIHDCLDGVNVYQSDPLIRQSVLVDNFNGISSKDCAPGYSVVDCVIARNSQYGIYAIGAGLSESGTTWEHQGEGNTIARIIQWWLLDVNVTDRDGIPIAAALVTVRASDGTKMANKTTDALGSVRDIELEGYRVENDGTTNTAAKYQLRVEKGERWAEKDVRMDVNKVLIVALGEKPTITENPWFWMVPVLVVLIVVVVAAYWWFRIR